MLSTFYDIDLKLFITKLWWIENWRQREITKNTRLLIHKVLRDLYIAFPYYCFTRRDP